MSQVERRRRVEFYDFEPEMLETADLAIPVLGEGSSTTMVVFDFRTPSGRLTHDHPDLGRATTLRA